MNLTELKGKIAKVERINEELERLRKITSIGIMSVVVVNDYGTKFRFAVDEDEYLVENVRGSIEDKIQNLETTKKLILNELNVVEEEEGAE